MLPLLNIQKWIKLAFYRDSQLTLSFWHLMNSFKNLRAERDKLKTCEMFFDTIYWQKPVTTHIFHILGEWAYLSDRLVNSKQFG